MAKRLSSTNVRFLLGKLIKGEASAQTITDATNASPAVFNVTAHGYIVGDVIYVSGTTGNTALNGVRKVSVVVDADHFRCTDLFSAAVVNGNGVTGGTPVCQRIVAGITPDDAADLIGELKRTVYSPGRLKDSQRPSATLETSIKTAFGL